SHRGAIEPQGWKFEYRGWSAATALPVSMMFFFFKQKTAYEIGLGIPAEPLFRSLLLRLVAFLLFLNPQCLASISRWITASSSWKRFCLFVCRALSSIMVICMLTAIRLLLTFVMSLYLLLRS